MKRPDIYFVITPNCNYRCKHCYLSAGPKRKSETISEKDFRQSIKHLPKTALDLGISGGEIFTIKDTLYQFLDYLNFENRRRKKKGQGKIETWLQTNGFWGSNDDRTNKILEELASFNVIDLNFAADDKYHRDQGANKKKIERVIELAEESGFFGEVSFTGTITRDYILPVGRAKEMNLRLSEIQTGRKFGCESKESLDRYDLSVMYNGDVSMCCTLQLPVIGNIIEEPLVDIVRRAKKDPLFSLMNGEGIEGLLKRDGMKKKDIRSLVDKQGTCGACFNIYREGIV
jgi:MoaA/NifB/PqqE/SkfB family radical SAM enzyme